MENQVLFQRKLIIIILIFIRFLLTNNEIIHFGNKNNNNNKDNLFIEEILKNYDNITSNIQNQGAILDKINFLLNSKKNDINTIKEKFEKMKSKNINTLNDLVKNSTQLKLNESTKQNFDHNYSLFCNDAKECTNIIDIHDNLLINSDNLNFGNNGILIQNDIFKVRGMIDILDIDINENIDLFKKEKAEHLIDFKMLDLKNFISKNLYLFSNLVFNNKNLKNHLFIFLIITNKSIKILDNNFGYVEKYNFGFKSDIVKADFSFYDEDNSIILITKDFEFIGISLEISLVSLALKINLIEKFDNQKEKLNVIIFNYQLKYIF